jgi:hypothetical protein
MFYALKLAGCALIGIFTTLFGFGLFSKDFAFNPKGVFLNLVLVAFWSILCHIGKSFYEANKN